MPVLKQPSDELQGAVNAYVALGSNLGDSVHAVQVALQALAALPQTKLLRASSLYRSAPVQASGPDFINAVAKLQTSLSPLGLLAALQALETRYGRIREYPNQPRTLDLDLLCHGHTVMQTEHLTLPHPRLHERAFVLLPLAEIAPEWVIAGRGEVATYLHAVSGQQIEKLATQSAQL
jgi:2-amino-4-hydroxy-6-hydroxymethyldihydropteridine diphosphokinase